MTGAAPRVRSGMDITQIKQKLSDRCVEKGTSVRSRQIDALVEVLVEEIAPIEERLAALEGERAADGARDIDAARLSATPGRADHGS